jgi:hypothetical protein
MPDLSARLHEAWIWTGGSLVLAVLAANVGWLLRDPASGPLAIAVARLRKMPGSSVLYQALRLTFYIGLPFAALLWGTDAVMERYLGLQPFEVPSAGRSLSGTTVTDNWVNWARDAGWAAAAGLATLALLILAWWTYRRTLAAVDLRETQPFDRPSGWVQLREAAFHEAHWAFYRNAPLIELRADPEGGYWGIWLGLGIVGLEAALSPAWRSALTTPERAPAAILRAALALLSALLFWRTQNLWLAIAVHLGVSHAMSAIAAATTRNLR